MAYTFKHGDRPLDGYTVQRAVGRGGFGEVYYAISDGGREVAIKYLRDNPQVELRGVSHCINLKSPHLVSIFDVKKTNEDDYCIIMEYCSGPSLRDLLIAEPNGFAPEKAAFFLREIAKGLSYLHDRGIVHRDLKPGNIFYDDGYVKIGDYGLAKIITVSRHSAQTASVGTVHYMAPEIGSGNYSRGVDIYALGVILYEMLMGTVPFEGSTMAEVLMKHLTSQPEVDKLPHPFGKVIRKALEKDPKDRYQTVDEMVDELLGVEEIEKSVAGFSPKSLQSAVKHGGAGLASPVPSPNPVPRQSPVNLPPFAIPVGSGRPLEGKAKRRLDRIARKVERKRAKLAGTKPNLAPPTAPMPVDAPQAPSPADEVDKHIRRRRIALTVFMAAVLSVGLGVLCAQVSNDEEIGGTAGMLIPALVGAIALGRKATRWFAIEQGPGWAGALVRAGCALPLLAIASAPILEGRQHTDGLAVWTAMILVAMFANWNKTIEERASGDISFWGAVWTGFGGLVAYFATSAFIADGPEDIYMWVTFGAAGITSLIVQASSWWLVPARGFRSGAPAPTDDRLQGPRGGIACCDVPFGSSEAETVRVGERWAQPHPGDAHDQAASAGPDDIPPAKLRWGITRAFWGFVALAASFGTIATFVLSLVGFGGSGPGAYDDVTGAILGCIGSFCLAVFALRKTTAVKRDGFWRETLRPFLLSAFMFGIGGPIVGISREWGHRWSNHSCQCVDDTGAAFLIAALVVSSLMFLFLTFFTGRRPKHPKSFLTGSTPGTVPMSPRRDQGFGVERIVAVGNAEDVDPLASAE